jgi:hypothetical protein
LTLNRDASVTQPDPPDWMQPEVAALDAINVGRVPSRWIPEHEPFLTVGGTDAVRIPPIVKKTQVPA